VFEKGRKQEIRIARPADCSDCSQSNLRVPAVTGKGTLFSVCVRWQDAYLEDTQAMLPGCVGSLNHSSTPRLKWVRDRASSILWLCTSTCARNSTEVPSVTSSFL